MVDTPHGQVVLAGRYLDVLHGEALRLRSAVKCRGFRGKFYLLDHFAFSRRDLPCCFCRELPQTMVIVSHDQDFLERTTTGTIRLPRLPQEDVG